MSPVDRVDSQSVLNTEPLHTFQADFWIVNRGIRWVTRFSRLPVTEEPSIIRDVKLMGQRPSQESENSVSIRYMNNDDPIRPQPL